MLPVSQRLFHGRWMESSGGDQTRVEIDNLREAMNLYLTSSKKQKNR